MGIRGIGFRLLLSSVVMLVADLSSVRSEAQAGAKNHGLVSAEWIQGRRLNGYAERKSDVSGLLAGNTAFLNESNKEKVDAIYFSADKNYVVVYDKILSKGNWGICSGSGGGEELKIDLYTEAGCVRIFTRETDGKTELIFLQKFPDNLADGKNVYKFASGRLIKGIHERVKYFLDKEAETASYLASGVKPEDVAELVSAYTKYQTASMCAKKGVIFDQAALKALATATKKIEVRINSKEIENTKWELVLGELSDIRQQFSADIYPVILEVCRVTSIISDKYIMENSPKPEKPF